MRLIIKDYLLQLKEKDELDLLICDILLQMGYIADNQPKTGNRQFGVDIRAHNAEEILLFVVKQGDLTRKVWDADQNAVRQSLDEIKDSYLNYINGADRKKKLHIIVATNGMIDEATRPNWEGYRAHNTNWDGMQVELDDWNIDTLTEYVQKYLFDEHIFDAEMQVLMRRALYFIGEADYRKDYYEQIVKMFISQLNDKDSAKVRKKKLCGVHLACQMIATYAEEAGYFKIGIMVSEYLIIKYWKHIMINNLFQKPIYIEWLMQYLSAYEKWNQKYYESVRYCCVGANRLPSSNPVEQKIILYEVLGYLISYAYYLSCLREYDKLSHKKCQDVFGSIVQLINNYPQFLYPPFDKHIGIISMLYRLLDKLGRCEDINILTYNQCCNLMQYYRIYKKYPSPADSFEDALNIYMDFPAEDYLTSAFWGTMLEWIVLMNHQKTYDVLRDFLSEDLSDVTKCTWFLRSEEEVKLYDDYAMEQAGEGVDFEIEQSFDEAKENISFVLKQYEQETFSFETYSFDALEFIICRYYGYLPRVKREKSEIKDIKSEYNLV